MVIICQLYWFWQRKLGPFHEVTQPLFLLMSLSFLYQCQSMHCMLEQGIHRHQTSPQYRKAAPRIAIQPITAERDVIHKTGST